MKSRLAVPLVPLAPPTPSPQAVVSPDPGFSGFRGLTHYDQRFAGTGTYANTQFTLEPPDQGLCAGNGFVMEAVNAAVAVYSPSGTRQSGPTALSQFFGLAPEFVRPSGPFLRVAKVAQADANQAKPLVWSEAMQLRIVHRHCRAIKPIG